MSDAKLSALLAPPSLAGLPAPRLDNPHAALRENRHWVFAAVRAICQEAAATPLAFFARRGSRPEWPRLEDLAPRHPALALFSRSPRELMSLTVAFLELTGDAYWYLPKNALGRPARVVVAHSQFMRVAAGGYEYRRGGRTISFAPDEIVHLRYPDPASDFYGRSPLAAAADQVAAFSAMKTAQRRSFENGAFPGLALTVRDALGKEQTEALRNDLARLYARPERAGRTLVLSGDVSAQPITLSPREMDFIESGRAGRDEILSAFGVPAAILGVCEDVNRSSIDGLIYAFTRFTLKPKLALVADAVNTHICPRFDGELWCEFELDIPRDRAEVRADWDMALLGLQAVPWGDRPWLPASRVQVEPRGTRARRRLARLGARLAELELTGSGTEKTDEK